MKVTTFARVPLLKRFRAVRRKAYGIRICLDCVVGIQFSVNAVYTRGKDKGRLFYVDPRTKVVVAG